MATVQAEHVSAVGGAAAGDGAGHGLEDNAGLEGCGGLDGLVGCFGEGEDLGEKGGVVGEGRGAEELPSGTLANQVIERLEQCIPVAVRGAGAGFDRDVCEVGDAHGVRILRLLDGEIL